MNSTALFACCSLKPSNKIVPAQVGAGVQQQQVGGLKLNGRSATIAQALAQRPATPQEVQTRVGTPRVAFVQQAPQQAAIAAQAEPAAPEIVIEPQPVFQPGVLRSQRQEQIAMQAVLERQRRRITPEALIVVNMGGVGNTFTFNNHSYSPAASAGHSRQVSEVAFSFDSSGSATPIAQDSPAQQTRQRRPMPIKAVQSGAGAGVVAGTGMFSRQSSESKLAITGS